MFVFASHDPGAHNHLLPLIEHARKLGLLTRCLDLRDWWSSGAHDLPDRIEEFRSVVLVLGCSSNRSERVLLRALRDQGISARTVGYVEMGVSTRLDELCARELCDTYIATNADAQEAIRSIVYGIGCESEVVNCGSTHFEQLRILCAGLNREAVLNCRQQAGIERHDTDSIMVSFFTAPSDESVQLEPCHVVNNLRFLLRSVADCVHSTGVQVRVLVRFHPRTSHSLAASLKAVCAEFSGVVCDEEKVASNLLVFQSSDLVLSLCSTVSIESIYVGSLAAFWVPEAQEDSWPRAEEFIRKNFSWRPAKDVPCLRSIVDLAAMLLQVRRAAGKMSASDVIIADDSVGALERAWTVLERTRMLDRAQ